MRIHRGYLFWGIFFLLLGGIPLAQRSGAIDADRLAQVGRLWPVALIAIGVAIVVARTRVALVGTVVTAIVLGGLAGSALAYGSGWAVDLGDCLGTTHHELEQTTQQGTLESPAHVDLTLNCGTLRLEAGTATSSLGGWVLDAYHRNAAPIVTTSGANLSIASPESTARRQEWTLSMPGEQLGSVSVSINAASAHIDVTGRTLDSLALEVNAGDARVLAGDATIGTLQVQANASRVSMVAGAGHVLLNVNAGAIDLCAAPDAALRITVDDGFALVTNLDDRGLQHDPGGVWTREGTGPALDIRVDGNASSFSLDPDGGCAA